MSESTPYQDDDRPRRSADCHVRDLEGEQVVYEPSSHEVVVLNETAALILSLCDGTHTVAELLAEMQRRYDAPEDVLRTDLHGTLSELRARAILS